MGAMHGLHIILYLQYKNINYKILLLNFYFNYLVNLNDARIVFKPLISRPNQIFKWNLIIKFRNYVIKYLIKNK